MDQGIDSEAPDLSWGLISKGKYSADRLLSLRLQEGILREYSGIHTGCMIAESSPLDLRESPEIVQRCSSALVEPLKCILSVNTGVSERLSERGESIVVGVLARALWDSLNNPVEDIVFQAEASICPQKHSKSNSIKVHIASSNDSSTWFEFEKPTSTASSLQYPFLIRLPPGLPPSFNLRLNNQNYIPKNPVAPRGLSYYAYAYITSLKAVQKLIIKYGKVWPKAQSLPRSSKVFVQFSKINIDSMVIPQVNYPSPSGSIEQRPRDMLRAIRTLGSNLMRGRTPQFADGKIKVDAALDRGVYISGDILLVKISICNPNICEISAVRITIKQAVQMRIGNEPSSQILKSTILEWEGLRHEARVNTHFQSNISLTLKPPQKKVFLAYEPRSLKGNASLVTSNYLMPTTDYTFRNIASPILKAYGLDRFRSLSVQYYVNVHAVVPWGPNITVRLPFHLQNSYCRGEGSEYCINDPTIDFPGEPESNSRQSIISKYGKSAPEYSTFCKGAHPPHVTEPNLHAGESLHLRSDSIAFSDGSDFEVILLSVEKSLRDFHIIRLDLDRLNSKIQENRKPKTEID